MKEIKSIEEIIYDYDNFIIDQWGVMHDGCLGYPKAITCVEKLIKAKKNKADSVGWFTAPHKFECLPVPRQSPCDA